jgi:hypothetical protein
MNTTNKQTVKLVESQFNPTVFLKAVGRIIVYNMFGIRLNYVNTAPNQGKPLLVK